MSADPRAFDPYRSPSLPEGPYAGRPPSGRPGLLTALCVFAIVLGVLGLILAVVGTGGLIAGKQLQKAFQPRPAPGIPPEMVQAQQDLQDEMYAVQARYTVPLGGLLLFQFVAALLLLVGGVRSLGLHETGRMVLVAGLGVACAFEFSRAIVQTMINLESMTAMNNFVEKWMESMPQNPGAPPGMQDMMGKFMRASMIASLVFSYALVLAKLALYVAGLVYLHRPRIRALFTTPLPPGF